MPNHQHQRVGRVAACSASTSAGGIDNPLQRAGHLAATPAGIACSSTSAMRAPAIPSPQLRSRGVHSICTQRFDRCVHNPLRVSPYQPVRAFLDGYRPLGILPHRQAGYSQNCRLPPDAAGIGEHQARFAHQSQEVQVAQRCCHEQEAHSGPPLPSVREFADAPERQPAAAWQVVLRPRPVIQSFGRIHVRRTVQGGYRVLLRAQLQLF